jgi:hypothetical protein
LKIKTSLPILVLSALLLSAGVACSSINNPFVPAAELSVVEVKAGTAASGQTGSLIGIRQSVSQVDGVPAILYTYTEPVVTVENKPLLPRVHFYKFQIEYQLADGTVLPVKEYPLSKSTANAALLLDIQFQVLSVDTDLRSVVYPGNRAPRVTDGTAKLKIFGKDINGYEHTLSTNFSIKFESLVFNENSEIPVPAPTASPGASPTPAASP